MDTTLFFTLYDTVSTLIYNVQSLVESSEDEIGVRYEAELRIGGYKGRITKVEFERINGAVRQIYKKTTSNNSPEKMEKYDVEIYRISDDRSSTLRKISEISHNVKERWEKKIVISSKIIEKYAIKIALSKEIIVDDNICKLPITSRKISRISYKFDGFSCDLSRVILADEEKYEIEIELATNPNICELFKVVTKIYCALYSTRYLYNKYELAEVERILNSFGINLKEYRFPKPIDVDPGFFKNGKRTYVTYKVDGERRFIVVNSDGVFDISTTNRVSMIYRGKINGLSCIVLDTELLANTYRIFDRASLKGNLMDRLAGIDDICHILNSVVQGYNFLSKPYFSFRDYHGMKIACQTSFVVSYALPIDGLVFVKENSSYFIRPRKWKFVPTVDLLYDSKGLYAQHGENKKQITDYEFRKPNIENGIYEFRLENRCLIPTRIRLDKSHPNTYKMVCQILDGVRYDRYITKADLVKDGNIWDRWCLDKIVSSTLATVKRKILLLGYDNTSLKEKNMCKVEKFFASKLHKENKYNTIIYVPKSDDSVDKFVDDLSDTGKLIMIGEPGILGDIVGKLDSNKFEVIDRYVPYLNRFSSSNSKTYSKWTLKRVGIKKSKLVKGNDSLYSCLARHINPRYTRKDISQDEKKSIVSSLRNMLGTNLEDIAKRLHITLEIETLAESKFYAHGKRYIKLYTYDNSNYGFYL